jgi:hypothetical protein
LGGYVGERGVDARPAAIDGVNVTHSVTAEFNSARLFPDFLWLAANCSGEGEKLISGEEVLGIWSMCVTETEKFFPCGTRLASAAWRQAIRLLDSNSPEQSYRLLKE